MNSSTSFGFLSLGRPRWLSQIAGLNSLQERKFQECITFHDILFHHIPVESPWMNGLAEREGFSLKVCHGQAGERIKLPEE